MSDAMGAMVTAEQALAEAMALAQRARWAEALAAVDRAIEAAPDAPEAHLARGRILRASGGDAGTALRAFRKATECEAPPARRAEALREYALALEPIGRHKEAAAALEEAIALCRAAGVPAPLDLPDLASRTHEKAGDAERALARHRDAERYYREVRRDVASYAARESELLEKLGRFDEMIRCYARLVDADPDRVLFARPDDERPSKATIERHKRLFHGINAVLEEHPDDIVALGFKAGFFYRLGRYRQAEALLARAIERAPHHFYAYHLLAKLHLKMGRPGLALETLEKARPLAPDYFDLARDRALALELCGRDEEALEAYRRIETRWPGGAVPGVAARRDLVLRAARLRERLGLLEEAYDSYRQASVIILPPDREMLEKLALLAMRLGRPREAERHLDEAMAAAPPVSREGTIALRLMRAAAREAAGNTAGALEEVEAALALASGTRDGVYREALARKAALLVKCGRAEEACACADALLEIDGDDLEALLLKGDALKAAKRFKESVECYSRAADRRLAAALLDEGKRLFEEARYDKALGKYNEAFRKDPESWEIFYHAAAAYARLAQAAPAAKYLEVAARANRGALAFMEGDRDFDAIRASREVRDVVARFGGAAGREPASAGEAKA